MLNQVFLRRIAAQLSRLWDILTLSPRDGQNTIEGRQTQFVAMLIIILAPTSIIIALLNAVRIGSQSTSFSIFGVGVALTALAYIVSRSRSGRSAALACVVGASAMIFVFITRESDYDQLEAAYYLVIPVLMSSIFFRTRFSVLVIVIQAVVLVLMPRLIPNILINDAILNTLAFYLITSIAITVVALYRNILEQDHQAEIQRNQAGLQKAYSELEARVAERTVELSTLNQHLREQISEREQAEKALAEERNLLRTVIDNLPDHVFALNTDGKYILSNQLHDRMFAKSNPVEVVGKTVFDVFDEQIAHKYATEENEIMKSGKAAYNIEQQNLLEGRPTRWFLTSKIPLRDASEKVVGLVGIGRDITERKLAEQVLQNSFSQLEERVAERTEELSRANMLLQEEIAERHRVEEAERGQRLLAEALSDTAAAINRTLNLNETFDRILTQISRTLPFESASIMLLDNLVARVASGSGFVERGLNMDEIMQLRFPIRKHRNMEEMYEAEHPIVIPDTLNFSGWHELEETRWIRSYVAAPIRVGGKVIGFINLDSTIPNHFNHADAAKLQAFADHAGIAIHNARLFEEITHHASDLEQRVVERTTELEQERAQLQGILNSMNEGVVGQILSDPPQQFVNSALIRMTGFASAEWKFEMLKPNDMPGGNFFTGLNLMLDRISAGAAWEGECKVQRKDGSEFDAYFGVTRVTNTESQVIGLVTIIRDISQEKVLQDQKSRFVANASHELRTPLTNLMTRLYLLRKKPERLDEHLEMLDRVANRMRSLVEDLLDYSRFERGIIPINCIPVDLRDLITDVVSIQESEAGKKHILLQYTPPGNPVMINADRERITQVITNLVINAIHYTPENGRVDIEINREPAMNKAVVHVRDSGPGIPDEQRPAIFLPFYRVSENSKGTGLGLTIAKEIVERHQGQIRVENRQPHGSDFVVELPLIDPIDGLSQPN